MEQQRNLWWTAAAPSLLLLAVVSVAVASSVTIPNTFTPGTVADANQVNANFVAVRNAVNDNDTRITAIETGASTLDADTLQGLAANQLVRASYATGAGPNNWDQSTYTALLTTSVQAPAAGILMVWSSTTAAWDPGGAGTSTELNERIRVGGTVVSGTGEIQFDSAATNNDDTLTMFSASAIAAPGAVSVVLEGLEVGDAGARLDLNQHRLMTLFVPFGNAGTQGVLKPGTPGAEAETSPLEEE